MSPSLFPRGVPVQKRLFDLLVTLVGGILIAPVLGITALVLWLTEGRPILFSQARAGPHLPPTTPRIPTQAKPP